MADNSNTDDAQAYQQPPEPRPQEPGQRVKGTEIIGHERRFDAEPNEEIKSRVYSNTGDTLDYVYEQEGDSLTIWAGKRGSPAYYRGTFSGEGGALTGACHYPGGRRLRGELD